jgi:hypothetical protein
MKNALFEQKKINLRYKRHLVENETEIVRRVLKIHYISLLLKDTNRLLDVSKCVCTCERMQLEGKCCCEKARLTLGTVSSVLLVILLYCTCLLHTEQLHGISVL